VDTFWRDLKYGARQLWRSPVFAVVAVLTLALGIGANTALFSLLHATVGKPLPGVQGSERLAWVAQSEPGNRSGYVSYADYRHYRDNNTTFSGLSAYATSWLSLGSGGEPERVSGQLVSGNYFDVLQVRFRLGRGFLPDEDRTPGTHPVAVVSYALWERRFNSDPNLVGRPVILNGQTFTVVGVASEGFNGTEFERPAEVWVPTMMHAAAMPQSLSALERPDTRIFYCFGRLQAGISRGEAAAEMRGLAKQLEQAYPEVHDELTVSVSPLMGWLHPGNQDELPPFALLCGLITGLILLIACANVANLLLSRAAGRGREIAIRMAIGAGRARVVRQLLTESLLLAVAGSLGGLIFSIWVTDLILAFVGLPAAIDPSPDARVLFFSLFVTVLATAAFGLAPALQTTRRDLVTGLKGEVALAGGGAHRSRLPRVFVISQMALSALLLVLAGLFLRTLQSVNQIDVGFTGRNDVLAVSLDLALQGYGRPASEAFHAKLLEQVQSLPGVQVASFANNVPLSSTMIRTQIELEGSETRPRGVFFNLVWPEYFRTIGTPLLKGRDFTANDGPGAPGVVIVSEALAREIWSGEEALGKRLRIAGEKGPFLEVVGVARDGKYDKFGERPQPFLYLPHRQYSDGLAGMILLVRSAGDATQLVGPVKGIVRQMDANLPLYQVQTLAQYIAGRVNERRKGTALLGVCGAIALLLAALGVYGVMASQVSQRTREIGIRMALGAQKREVLRLFLAHAVRLAVLSVGIGLGIALALAQVISSLLFGISPADPVTYLGAGAILTLAAALAAYVPARRATRIDPMVALRYE
jgi:macrolide transport system ATP-binding/permease protein